MERNDARKQRKRRKRLNAMLPHQDVLTKEERAAIARKMAVRQQECVCAPASYKIMEELIEDPVNEEKERRRKALEKWTKETERTFAKGLVTHGKDFRKISESLPNMTTSDCVEHYYMTKHCPNFKELKAEVQAEADINGVEQEGTSSGRAQVSSLSEPHQSVPDVSVEFETEEGEDLYFNFYDN